MLISLAPSLSAVNLASGQTGTGFKRFPFRTHLLVTGLKPRVLETKQVVTYVHQTSIQAVGSFGNESVISVSPANNGERSCKALSAVILAR